ncbi:hypothetical protein BS333_19620 [Vibrio azureus]|uniref:Uncharacterized protein n=2 Tax=Vibrio azureus TaxID=512649 RepID=U3C6M2_9VIBR|nr:hypothetical protein [Vibrio azureus]AUI88523.1 hypothetical protein BS333_19620 [Vibrio azureus]GAD77044.1 hypothetical protein VAZ01S_059_00030 [Vibrio azureus NBRC 104587]
MENWIKQAFNQNGPFEATDDKSRFGILPGLILDFTLFPGLYIHDDLDISDDLQTTPAMVRLNGEDEWEFEFLHAVAVHQVESCLGQGEQIMLAYDKTGLYFHPLLAEKITNSEPLPRLHRQL